MKRRVKVGVVGWIDPGGPWPLPMGSSVTDTASQGLIKGHPSRYWWVVKSYLGLMATTNTPPPASLLDVQSYQSKHDFRALVWVDIQFDDAPGSGPVHATFVGSKAQSCIVDPGWTPPVDVNKVGALAVLKQLLIDRKAANDKLNQVRASEDEGLNDIRRMLGVEPKPNRPPEELPYGGLGNKDTLGHLQDQQAYAGERSPLSAVHVDRLHPNSVFANVPHGERLVASGLIRFRAGQHTNDVGLEDAGAQYHVPWVWAEFLLTSLGDGQVRLRGAGSIFPTIAWYLDDRQVAPPHRQVGDSNWPQPLGPTDPRVLKIWPVLSAGAPKTQNEPPLKGDRAPAHGVTPVTKLPWTCPGSPWIDVRTSLKRS